MTGVLKSDNGKHHEEEVILTAKRCHLRIAGRMSLGHPWHQWRQFLLECSDLASETQQTLKTKEKLPVPNPLCPLHSDHTPTTRCDREQAEHHIPVPVRTEFCVHCEERLLAMTVLESPKTQTNKRQRHNYSMSEQSSRASQGLKIGHNCI